MAKKIKETHVATTPSASKSSTLSSDQMMSAILSYLGILVLIPLLAIKNRDEFSNFHIRQGIVLFAVEVILMVVGMAFGALFWVIGFMFSWILTLVWLVLLIVSVVAIIKAIQGEKWSIPVVSNFTSMVNI